MKNIYRFLIDLRLHSGALWFDGNSLRLSAPIGFQDQKTEEFIVNNKPQIILLLKENNIFSKEVFLTTTILRDSSTSCYPLSPAQQRMWFIEKYERGANAYNMPLLFELANSADVHALKYSIQQTVSRHEVLRSTIEHSDNLGEIQIVHDEPLPIEEIVLTDGDDFESVLKSDINYPFDLEVSYPIRVKFYMIQSENETNCYSKGTFLLINVHHIACDGWSRLILQQEIFHYYKEYLGNRTSALPALEIQYKDYALWQQSYLATDVLDKQLSYWKTKLSGYQALELPTDYARPTQIDYTGEYVEFTLDNVDSKKLRDLVKHLGVTLHSALLSSFNILLSKYTGQEDIIVGTAFSNRHHRQTEGLIGLFANMQAIRTILNKSQSYESLILQVHQEQIEAQLHQDLPFEKIVDELDTERNTSRHPIFQITFEVQNIIHQKNASDVQKNYLRPLQTKNFFEASRFDLSLYIDDNQEELKGRAIYATRLFNKQTIERFIRHYKYLLTQLLETSARPYSELSVLFPEEFNKIIYTWNAQCNDYPKNKTIYQLFQEQAEKKPHNIALVYQNKTWTYKDVNEKSNQLARYIRAQYLQREMKELEPDAIIALYMDRGPEMIIGILAVLKAGGAYVPMDPSYPQERIDYLLTNTSTTLVLSTLKLNSRENKLPREKVLLIDLTEKFYTVEDSSDLPQYSTAHNLAYVIFTSGTTGKPKGVMVEHHQVASFVIKNTFIDYDKVNIVAAVSNYAFDGSVFDILFSLSNGKQIVLIEESVLSDLSTLDSQLTQARADTIFITTAFFNSLVLNRAKCLGTLRQVLFGGEACNIDIVNQFKSNYREADLVHVYGPTENIVFSSYCRLNDFDTTHVVPIGVHTADKNLYVLDKDLKAVQQGVVGELYIGGSGVARGYLNNNELTDERFIPNPYVTTSDKANGYTRLYKTGDWVRWLADGCLDYIGRKDEQVKIRGYRIELEEIEHALSKIKGVKQCCVLAKERQTDSGYVKYLVAYYILEDGNDSATQGNDWGSLAHILPDYMTPAMEGDNLTKEDIREKLSGMVPEYMVPAAFVSVESFPLTINGKIDKRSLPEPELASSAEKYVPPVTETEIELCKIWQDIIGLDKVGVTDDFFKIGGDSILTIRIVSKIEQLGINITVKNILQYKTIQNILRNCYTDSSNKETRYAPFSLVTRETKEKVLNENNLTENQIQDIYPASYLQFGMLMDPIGRSGNDVYHDVLSCIINAEFKAIAFRRVWQSLISKHEQLRTTFIKNECGYLNVVHKSASISDKLLMLNARDSIPQFIEKEKYADFDLTYPGLFRLFVSPNGDKNFTLIISIHHAITDGWSVATLISEFVDVYVNNKPMETTSIPSYGKFVGKELEALKNNSLKQFWLQYLAGYNVISIDRRSKNVSGETEQVIVHGDISASLNIEIINISKDLEISPSSVFLGAYNLVMSLFFNSQDLVIGTVVNNRLEEDGGDKVFGVHLNTIPIRFSDSYKYQHARDYLLGVFNNRLSVDEFKLYPYAKIKSDLGLQTDLYQGAFNFVHFHVAEENYYNRSIVPESLYEKTNIPLTLQVQRFKDTFHIALVSYTYFMDLDTAGKIVSCITLCIEQMTSYPKRPIKSYQFLTDSTYQQIIYDWNKTDKDYPKDKTIHQLFEEQAERTPNGIALTYEEKVLTYQQLNEKSNQVAHHIRQQYLRKGNKALKPDTLIALCMNKSLEMVIGILGVLKAGGAYVPIDPSYPLERINFILEDTNTELILCQKQIIEDGNIKLPFEKVVYIDLDENLYNDEFILNPTQTNKATDLAYVIYTSGTTGKPKGVMVEHRSIVNLIHSQKNRFYINTDSKVLQYASYVFDASVWEIFSALSWGAGLFITPAGIRQDAHLVSQYLAANKISHALLPPVILNMIPDVQLNSLATLLVGGDLSAPELIQKWNLERSLINAYGPTEGTVCATMHKYHLTDLNTNIGKPLDNIKLYVLDNNLNPVPIGVIGELYIGGACLARGYLNNEQLTAECFIPNPFPTETDRSKHYTRLYKTGDWVRYNQHGDLEYIGRNDEQIKIRGYRIEPGEIEQVLMQIPGIGQCCVLAKEKTTEIGHTKYLAAYYVLNDLTGTITPDAIFNKLSEKLPEYMLPALLIELKSFPLTITGKLDRHALPESDLNSQFGEFIQPKTDTEIAVCKLWQEVLGHEKVGMKDDFFRLGGNSILAVQISYAMTEILDHDVSVADIFQLKTIDGLLHRFTQKPTTHSNVEWDFAE